MSNLMKLVQEVRTAYHEIPPMVVGKGVLTTWVRPPLITDAKLGKLVLKDFLVPRLVHDVSELRELFEAYVEMFIVTDNKRPDIWVSRQLNMTPTTASLYFPPNASALHILVAYLWYCQHAQGVAEVTHDANSFLIHIADTNKSFGIFDRKLVSFFHNGVDVPINCVSALQADHQKGRGRKSNDLGLANFWRKSFEISDKDVQYRVQLALRILFYRFGHLGRLVKYLYQDSQIPVKSRRGLPSLAKRLSKRLSTLGNPMPMLHTELCPKYLTKEEMQTTFTQYDLWASTSTSKIVDVKVLVEWGNALKQLAGRSMQHGVEDD